MNRNERIFIGVILFFIFVVITLDLFTDYQEGASWWHLMTEGTVAIAAIAGVFYLIRGSYVLRHSLRSELKKSAQLEDEAEKWRVNAKKYTEGLSGAIDDQLTSWGLSTSEKEIAFLLLKGLGLKEIAKIRHTAERTARTQSISIYSKTGLSGRSALAAFFLEDLFLPADINRKLAP